MNKRLNFLAGILMMTLFIGVSGCSKQATDESEILVKVNGYEMTVADFNAEIENSPYAGDENLDKEKYLEFVVRKQILIQEAQKQGIDRRESFMEAIERYWKQTLIKELLGEQTQKVYSEVKESDQSEVLDVWIQNMYDESEIEVNKDVLEEIK